jgi:hypothetical protein
MPANSENFRWGTELVACFDDLRPHFGVRSPPIVDREVVPHFDGRPDDMFIWFICERAVDVAPAEAQRLELQAAVQERMTAGGFPKQAVDSLRSGVTSLEDINAGGGRFYYFR